jgi:hypothetical protein
MLLDERVPPTKEISRDEALVELITRFFQSHGPAQVQDFVWWSGLSIADMKHGVELMGSTIQHEVINEKIYWWIGSPTVKKSVETSFLVPAFDEYFVAYKDRRDILDADHEKEMNVSGAMISGAVLINGKIKGKWSRKFEKKTVVIKINLFEKITKSQEKSIAEQAEKYGRFINLPVSQR